MLHLIASLRFAFKGTGSPTLTPANKLSEDPELRGDDKQWGFSFISVDSLVIYFAASRPLHLCVKKKRKSQIYTNPPAELQTGNAITGSQQDTILCYIIETTKKG